MAMSIDDILMQRALQDEELENLVGDFAIAAGGGTGTVLGIMNGKGPKNRMAGGFIGALLGGSLGKGLQMAAIEESPAAGLLAKMQVQGSLNTAEKAQLEKIVKEAYSNQLGGMA
jgi:hypothetical protein